MQHHILKLVTFYSYLNLESTKTVQNFKLNVWIVLQLLKS